MLLKFIYEHSSFGKVYFWYLSEYSYGIGRLMGTLNTRLGNKKEQDILVQLGDLE